MFAVRQTLLSLGIVFFCWINNSQAGLPAAEPSEQEFKTLSQTLWWKRLMHYDSSLFGRTSRADGQNFFISPNGKTDPEAELRASFLALQSETPPKHHVFAAEKASCLYPARFLFFKKSWPQYTQSWKPVRCDRLEDYLAKIRASSVSLIFSSYYLNSPASAFGHTLLRFNKSENVGRSELLDYGVNFAARTHPNVLVNNLGGLLGYLPGHFSVVPYYYKVQEYNDVESRDLWEYELNLTEFEVDFLTRHFWELGHTYFDYFYLRENCSYHMLSALEAAAPRLELTKNTPFYVMPVDTVKAVIKNAGLVKNIRYRPSKRTQFLKRLEPLTFEDREKLKTVLMALDEKVKSSPAAELNADSEKVSPKLLVDSKNPQSSAQTLDAAIDYWDYRYYDKLINKDKIISEQKAKLLLLRSQQRVVSEDFSHIKPTEASPDQGHGSARSMVALSKTSNHQAVVLAHRFALHDLEDPIKSYLPYGEIEFFNAQARVVVQGDEFEKARGQLRLDHLYLFQVKSSDPYHDFFVNRSWRISAGAERVIDSGCEQCVPATISGGYGQTYSFWKGHGFITALIGADLQYSSKFRYGDFRGGVGPDLAIHFRFGALSASLEGQHRIWAVFPLRPTQRFEHHVRYHITSRISVGLQAQHSNDFWDGQAQLLGYF